MAQWTVCLFPSCSMTDDQGAFAFATPIGLVQTGSLTFSIERREIGESFEFEIAIDSFADGPLDITVPVVRVTGILLDAAGNPARPKRSCHLPAQNLARQTSPSVLCPP